MTTPIYVVAFPKSGSTYLSRLLGDALDSPVDGVADALPLAKEGQERKGDYIVYQTHLAAHHMGAEEGLVPNRFRFNLDQYQPSEHIVIHLIRDPRAIVVSAQHYWGIPTLGEALDAIYDANPPVEYHYPTFIEDWLNANVYHVKYESLLDDPESTLLFLFQYFRIPYSIHRLRRAIERQAFDIRKKELSSSGDKYPYAQTIQSHNLRCGKKGEWRNHWTPELEAKAQRYFGKLMQRMGYMDTGWDNALLKLRQVFDILPDAGLRKAQVLYELARAATSGALVELGVAQGKGVIAMALGTQDSGDNLPVYAVDDYQEHLDWANNKYDESNLSILQDNARRAGVEVNVVRGDAGRIIVDEGLVPPIALWCWDISTNAEDLWQHWLTWYPYIQANGIAFIRDLFDKRFDSDRVKAHALTMGFVVESEEPGILLLRKL